MTLAKSSKQLAVADAPAMARLLLLVTCAAASGCLLPQDDVVYPDLPPAKNSPLRIVATKPQQAIITVPIGTTPGCKPEFNATVVDPDHKSDSIRSLWFVDPQGGDFMTARLIVSGATVFPNVNDGRTVTAPTAVITQLSSLNDGRPHNLWVFVTDGEFVGATLDTFKLNRTLPDGTTVEDSAYIDSFWWQVEVQACP